MAELAWAVEYTDCIYAEGYETPNECPGYEIKKSEGKAPVMMELWGMWSSPSLLSLSALLWPRVAAPDRVLSMGQIELFDI